MSWYIDSECRVDTDKYHFTLVREIMSKNGNDRDEVVGYFGTLRALLIKYINERAKDAVDVGDATTILKAISDASDKAMKVSTLISNVSYNNASECVSSPDESDAES